MSAIAITLATLIDMLQRTANTRLVELRARFLDRVSDGSAAAAIDSAAELVVVESYARVLREVAELPEQHQPVELAMRIAWMLRAAVTDRPTSRYAAATLDCHAAAAHRLARDLNGHIDAAALLRLLA